MSLNSFISLIEEFRLKKGQADKLILHTGDIVIDQSKWRKIKKQIRSDENV